MALVLLAVLALPGRAAEAADEATVVFHLAQGRFLLEGGQVKQALAEFEAAAALPEGQRDPAIHELLARTRYRLGDVGGAVEAARTVAALTPRLSEEFEAFHEFLTTRFGKVLVVGAGMEGAGRPEPVGPLLDPELKRSFEAALQRLGSAGVGSTSVYLPVGSYRVSGHIVDVVAGTAARMDLRPSVGVSGSGVYGERRGGGPVRRAEPPGLGLTLQLGGLGYGQQGRGGAGGRALAALEIGPAGGVARLHLGADVGIWRAERLRGEGSAPPAGVAEGRVGAVLALPLGARLRAGPVLAWTLGATGAPASALPPGYVGPSTYLVHGPELGVRWEAQGAAAPALAVEASALLRESWPRGLVLPEDARPHLSVGAVLGVGIALR